MAMRYNDIKTMDQLEEAQRQVKRSVSMRESAVKRSFADMKESYSPSNMLLSGLKSISSYIPVDQLLLSTVRAAKRKLLK